MLEPALARDPEATALISRNTRWTWRDVDDVTGRIAAALLDRGLEPGDRVASLMPNRPALIFFYLACWRAGLVATPLNYRYMAPELDHAFEVSKARALLMHAEREADVAATTLGPRLPLGTIRYGRGESTSLERLLEKSEPRELPRPSPDAPAAIFFTSGSTGAPKGVTHSHATLGWMFAIAANALEFSPDDTLLAGSSLSHIGACYISFAAIGAGATTIVARTFDGDELLPLLRADRPTVLSMLPSALFALTRDHGARHGDFASLRLCRAAGDKVSSELDREFTALSGLTLDEAYGMTEMGLMAVSPPSGVIKLGSVGPAVPGVELVMRDQDGGELDPGEEGRMWARSRSATVGYWDDPEATAKAFTDGWLDSGDLMRADEDGYLWFCGRKKQIIVHDGSNICPQDVEGALAEHPAVRSACVIGIHNEVHGENVRAYVTFEPGREQPTSQELIRFARERVGYKAPEEIVVLDEMPTNVTGKVDRAGIIRMAEENIHGELVRGSQHA
jgi:acyl-CoA synthetase (AMP-forming)/AMP-acid ligase II